MSWVWGFCFVLEGWVGWVVFVFHFGCYKNQSHEGVTCTEWDTWGNVLLPGSVTSLCPPLPMTLLEQRPVFRNSTRSYWGLIAFGLVER